MNDIYYIVKLKDNFSMPHTTIKKKFCGRILVSDSSGVTVFELNGSKAIVVIQLENIDWMAPSEVLWSIEKEEGGDR